MKKPTKIHDLQYYRAAQINVARLEKVLKDLESAEDLLYNHIQYGSIWSIIQKVTDTKVRLMYDYQGWLDTLKNKGEVND